MRWYAADLHVHSVLSPCGDLRMAPGELVARARAAGVSLLGLSDHNSARNAPALATCAAAAGLATLYGLEVRSAEEVDLLTIFDSVDAARAFGEWVWDRLPAVPCDARVFGDQVVVDAAENVVELVDRLLIGGLTADLQEVAETARAAGGLVIPAHVDRRVDSVISQLGFLPPELPVDAVELSRYGDETSLVHEHPWLATVPVVRFSDAHLPEDIGYQQTRFLVAEPTVAELRMALEGRDGRRAEPLRQALRRSAIDGTK
ncbi:MAG: PHP domain-containing protein [Fimbriimonadaceae bacterium]|nr:PHP domain-containing protein [Fimbriimonadaceae bacterium]